eukprot:7278370-Prymnesium_polylepis.1
MEMHCSPIQQRRVAKVLIQRLGDVLLSVRRCTKCSHHKLLAIDHPFDSLLAACAVRWTRQHVAAYGHHLCCFAETCFG